MGRLCIYICLFTTTFLFCKTAYCEPSDVFTEGAVLQAVGKLSLTGSQDFKQCGETKDDFVLSIWNTSDRAAYQEGTYSIDWGDGSPVVSGLSYNAVTSTHTYTKLGVFKLRLKALTNGGVEESMVQEVVNESRPALGLSMSQTGLICAGDEIKFTVGEYDENSSSTKYILDYGDDTPQDVFTAAQVVAEGGKFSHIYQKSHCDLNRPEGLTITVIAENACQIRNTMTNPNNKIIAKPVLSFNNDEFLCTETPSQFVNTSTGGKDANCQASITQYEWNFGDGTPPVREENPEHIYMNPGEYTVTLTGTTTIGCNPKTFTKKVTVIKVAKVRLQVTPNKICEGEVVTCKGEITGDNLLYQWVVNPNLNYNVVSGSMTSPEVQLRFTRYGNYNVQLDVSNRCSQKMENITVAVLKDPELAAFRPINARCPGVVNLQPYLSYVANGNKLEVDWTITGPAGGYTYVSGFNKQSLYPQLDFKTPGTYTLHVKLASVGCEGDKLEGTQTIVIYDPVILKNIQLTGSNTICENDKVAFVNTSTGTNLTTSWSVVPSAGVDFVVGTSASPSPTLQFTRYGKYAVTALLNAACGTKDTTFNITVNKDPNISFFYLQPSICPDIRLDFESCITYEWMGNTPDVTWKFEMADGTPAAGIVYLEGTNNRSVYPKVKFMTPGIYKVSVEIPSAGCPWKKDGADRVLATSGTITVHSPAMSLTVMAGATEVCERGQIEFTSIGTAVGMVYDWSVDPMEHVTFLDFGTDKPKARIRFDKYGTYQVSGKLTGYCGDLDSTITIKVKRDPSVAMTPIPDACPGTIDVREYVKYNWYNNTAKNLTWRVNPNNGFAFTGGTTAQSLEPKIAFTKAGNYTLTVELNGAGCVADSLIAWKSFTIYDTAITGGVSIDDGNNVVCEDETVHFVNTTAGQGLQYQWRIEGDVAGYSFANGTGQTTKDLELKFLKNGDYIVRLFITGTCNTRNYTFPVHVKRDPSVALGDLPDGCPRVLDLAGYVTYNWYNNTNKNVTWSVSPNSGFVYAGGTTAASLEPKIEFKQAGRYILTAQLAGAGCVADSLTVFKTFTVYDTAITGNVTPVGGADLCEGEVLHFENTTAGQGLTYAWDITGDASGYSFEQGTGVTTKEIKVKFTKYGAYTVRLTVDGTCNSRVYTFQVVVRGIPAIDYRQPVNMCANQELNLGDYVTYTKNNSILDCKWTVFPDRGHTFVTPATDEKPIIRFTAPDHYLVTLTVMTKCGGEYLKTYTVNVLDTDMGADFSALREGCTDLSVPLTNKSKGDSLKYTWNVTPAAGWEFTAGDATAETGTLLFRQAGNYRVKLKIQNICGTDTVSLPVRAYSTPVITAADISNVCETGFEFIGRDHIRINPNNDPVNNVRWTITPEGYQWLNGTNGISQLPDLKFASGDYRVKGEFRNACPDAGVVEFDVKVDKFIPIAPLRDTVVCHFTEPFLLQGNPAQGIWSSVDGMVEHRTDYFYNPKMPGDFEVVYSKNNLSCMARDTMNVHVNPLPYVNGGLDIEMCLNHPPHALVGQPAGGGWQGPGVANDVFTPFEAAAEQLKYYYADPVTGCINVDSIVMQVHPLPDPEFDVDPMQCLNTEVTFTPRQFDGNEFFWDYGDGDDETTTVPAVHVYNPHGFYDISMICTSVHGCKDTSSVKRIEVVNDPADAYFEMDKDFGCAPLNVNFWIDSTEYGDKNLHFHWDMGNGITFDKKMPDNPLVYPSGVWDTTYKVTYKVYNMCGSREMEDFITVHSSPKAHFELMHEWECSPVEVMLKNTSTGNRTTFEWIFGDGTTDTESVDARHTYTTGKSTTVYNIQLIAKSMCGVDTATRPITIKPRTVSAFFVTPKSEICQDEEICFKNFSSDTASSIINKYWDYGDGSRDTTWDGCHSFEQDGNYRIKLYIDNGCGFDTISDVIRVRPLPKLVINSEPHLCENDTFNFVLASDQPLKTIAWDLGDGTTEGRERFNHVYARGGTYTVNVEVLSDQIPSCPGTASKQIEVYFNPDLKITPLDSAACAPFLYAPIVEGEGFVMWDYGENTGLTSALEHTYDNTTPDVLEYDIVAYAKSTKGCTSDYKGHITVYSVPEAAIATKVTEGKPQKVEFVNLSSQYDQCIWYLPTLGEVVSPDNQFEEYNENGERPVSLVASNRYGCRDSVSLVHETVLKGLFFPNTFIPHSDDPKSNRFNGVAMGVKEYHLQVFDRYGNLVWETREIENGAPAAGWDGTNPQGQPMPQGVYIWRAKAVFLDGNTWNGNNQSGTSQTTQGTVFLLRR